jgi:hypothetical protein
VAILGGGDAGSRANNSSRDALMATTHGGCRRQISPGGCAEWLMLRVPTAYRQNPGTDPPKATVKPAPE